LSLNPLTKPKPKNNDMLLDTINSPKDLKNLTFEQLSQLAGEIRQRMIEVVSATGGHLASSLGAVELILALHYCLNTPDDKIVFDVGHQAYAHKIITGRGKNFSRIRQPGGLSGFPCFEESPFDVFTTGHSSSAVSLALGLACARDSLCLRENYFKVVAVIGDGSLSGGLCFEGLNNAGHQKKDLLVVLNTNELSIAPNVGALSVYLNKLISLPIYNRFKDSLDKFVKSRIPKGSRLLKIANKFEEGLKGLFVPGIFFEELGFRYFGPFDGHNLSILIPTLKNIFNIKGPVLLHVITKKGKGYPPAENEPIRFHSASPFEVATGKGIPKAKGLLKTYTEVFSDKLIALACNDKRIIAITAAMPEGTGLDKFRDNFPDRLFDVGIAEPHALCFASGSSKAGLKPLVAIYSTFLQRAYDQILEDIALQKANVVFAIDRAGIVGEDGMTHQGIFDIAFLLNVPGMIVMAPKDKIEFEKMLEFAFSCKQPVSIRYPKAVCPFIDGGCADIELGKAQILKEGADYGLIAFGSMVEPSLEAARMLERENLAGTIVNARFAKPFDETLFEALARKVKFLFTAEEGIVDGGFGNSVARHIGTKITNIGLPCEFISCGKREFLLENYGLDSKGIAEKIKSVCLKNS